MRFTFDYFRHSLQKNAHSKNALYNTLDGLFESKLVSFWGEVSSLFR